jgi:hypothetical protein
VSTNSISSSTTVGRVGLRARVAIKRDELTRELASGVPAGASPELALRASQLSSRRGRRQMAGVWRHTVEDAHHPVARITSIPPIRRRAVLDADDVITDLIARLGADEPVAVRGLAMLNRVVTDGADSPLYSPAEPGALRRQLEMAAEAMQADAA